MQGAGDSEDVGPLGDDQVGVEAVGRDTVEGAVVGFALEAALARREKWGVWGGTGEAERRRLSGRLAREEQLIGRRLEAAVAPNDQGPVLGRAIVI